MSNLTVVYGVDFIPLHYIYKVNCKLHEDLPNWESSIVRLEGSGRTDYEFQVTQGEVDDDTMLDILNELKQNLDRYRVNFRYSSIMSMDDGGSVALYLNEYQRGDCVVKVYYVTSADMASV